MPPLVGVAVNVDETPAQIAVEPEILTAGTTGAATVMVIEFEVAGFPVTPAKFDVITQVTICPFVKVAVV